jgi:hypothetical protein
MGRRTETAQARTRGTEAGRYGDLRNLTRRCRRRVARDLPLTGDSEQRRWSLSTLLGRCHGGRPGDLAVISIVVERAVDLGVRPPDGRSGTASTVD